MGWYPRYYKIYEAPLQVTDARPLRPLYKPSAGRAVFQPDAESNESQTAYNRFESVATRLFEMFKWYYDYAGETPPEAPAPGQTAPEFKPTVYELLQKAALGGFRNLDGTAVTLAANGNDPFEVPNTQHPYDRNDQTKVDLPHVQSVFLLGGQQTGYHVPGRPASEVTGFHVAPDMAVAKFGRPLGQLMDDASEVAPLIFPTDHNYFEESMTGSFLTDTDYDHSVSLLDFNYKKRSDMTETLGIPAMFNTSGNTVTYSNAQTGLSNIDLKMPSILFDGNVDFGKVLQGDNHTVENRVLNMALQYLMSASVIYSAFIDLVGPATDAVNPGMNPRAYQFAEGISTENISQIDSWVADGANAQSMSPFHLNLLTYLSTFSHMFSYAAKSLMIGSGSVGDSAHGEIWVNKNGTAVTFRSELQAALNVKMTDWTNELNGNGEVQRTIDLLTPRRAAQVTRKAAADALLAAVQDPPLTADQVTYWTAESADAATRISNLNDILTFLANIKADASLDITEKKAAIDQFVTDNAENLYLSDLAQLKARLIASPDQPQLVNLLKKGSSLASAFGIESIALQGGAELVAETYGVVDSNPATRNRLEQPTNFETPLSRMWYSYSGHWRGANTGYIEGIIDGSRTDLIDGDRWYRWLNRAYTNSKKFFVTNIFESMGKSRETKSYTRSVKSFESAQRSTQQQEEAEQARDAQMGLNRRQSAQQALESLGAKLRSRQAELNAMAAESAGRRRSFANATTKKK